MAPVAPLRPKDFKLTQIVSLAYLNGLGIVSVGRNAEFEYINMDEAVRRALAATARLDGEQ